MADAWKRLGGGEAALQAVLFRADEFTPPQAADWLRQRRLPFLLLTQAADGSAPGRGCRPGGSRRRTTAPFAREADSPRRLWRPFARACGPIRQAGPAAPPPADRGKKPQVGCLASHPDDVLTPPLFR